MAYVWWAVASVVIGAIAAWVARRKGLNPYLWFAIGAVANIFILLIWKMVQDKRKVVDHERSAGN